MTPMLFVPLDDTVVFPTMDVTLPVDVGDEERVLLAPRHGSEFAKVGTIAEVTDHVRIPGGGRAVQLSGVARGVVGAGSTDPQGRLRVEVTEHPDTVPVDGRTRELEREQGAEAGTIRSYLDWLLQVPWNERSEERLDPVVAREVLDADHAGLEDVKDRIVEYIAVAKLRKERGLDDADAK